MSSDIQVIPFGTQHSNERSEQHLEKDLNKIMNNEQEVKSSESESTGNELPEEIIDSDIDMSDHVQEMTTRPRRFSLGKIPVPPVPVTIADLREAAKKNDEIGHKKTVDPRRSSVNLDIYRSFRETDETKKTQNKNQIVYVETKGKFRKMKKGMFQIERMLEIEREAELELQRNVVIPEYLQDVGSAYHAQRAFNQVAHIMQGFLAGISISLAVFAYKLEDDVLLETYRWMSMPIHVFFTASYTMGLVTAIDRTGIYEIRHFTSSHHIKQFFLNNSFINVIIWSIGLISSLMCIKFDSILTIENGILSANQIATFRIYCVIRAISASLGWLLHSYKPDTDTVAMQMKISVMDNIRRELGGDYQKREMMIKALGMG